MVSQGYDRLFGQFMWILFGTGPRFTNGFSIAIQIRWKFRFTLISILIQWSLQNFVHGTTAVLSWHVQTFVAIWWPATELQQGEVSIEFELRAKIVSETGPRMELYICVTTSLSRSISQMKMLVDYSKSIVEQCRHNLQFMYNLYNYVWTRHGICTRESGHTVFIYTVCAL